MKLNKHHKKIIEMFARDGAQTFEQEKINPEKFAIFLTTEIRHLGGDGETAIGKEYEGGLENKNYTNEEFKKIHTKYKTAEAFGELMEDAYCHKEFEKGFAYYVSEQVSSSIMQLLRAVGNGRKEI